MPESKGAKGKKKAPPSKNAKKQGSKKKGNGVKDKYKENNFMTFFDHRWVLKSKLNSLKAFKNKVDKIQDEKTKRPLKRKYNNYRDRVAHKLNKKLSAQK